MKGKIAAVLAFHCAEDPNNDVSECYLKATNLKFNMYILLRLQDQLCENMLNCNFYFHFLLYIQN